MNALKQFGFWLTLFPVALCISATTSLMAFVVFLISIAVNRKVIVLDLFLVFLLASFALGWMRAVPEGKEYVVSQVASYVVFTFALRFFYVCREDLLAFILKLTPMAYGVLCLVYLAAQLYIGYTYEVGVLEAFLLIRLAISDRRRVLLLTMFIVYMLLEYMISTRSTPMIVAMLIVAVFVFRPPRRPMQLFYIAVIILTPAYGFLMYHWDIELDVSGVDDNAAIRLEMIKGATSLIGVKEFLLGTGLGVPFRNMDYDYAFSHPLLNSFHDVMQVSNHNSIFDFFLRFGVVAYILFALIILKAGSLSNILSPRSYALVFITLYNLSVNAYLDSTRLTVACAMLIAGVFFACERTVPRAKQVTSSTAAAHPAPT